LLQKKWVPFAAAGFLTILICLTVNFRAFTEYRRESTENETLNNQVQTLTTENLALQEEIHSLKSDPQTLEREAKKFGFERPKDKNPVPTK
jgi:cell division protein FtsB